MMFSSPLILLATALGAISQVAYAAPLEARDVYAPHLTYPHQGTVWHSGQRHNVTWDASSPPKQITNPIGQVWLRKGDVTTKVVLAKDFKLTAGRVEITVPSVESSDDYELVLFGDSGNFSPKFTILN